MIVGPFEKLKEMINDCDSAFDEATVKSLIGELNSEEMNEACSYCDRLAPKNELQKEYIRKIVDIMLENMFVPVEEDEEEKKTPTQFIQINEQTLETNDERYTLVQKLGGRGQAGFAAFYKDENGNEILLKEDDAATCMAEATAAFVREAELLPKHLADAVNYASIATLEKEDKTKVTASLQQAVKGQPWDVLLLGQKRDPKTLFSIESWYQARVKSGINSLSAQAKTELAAAIMASVLAGDESLHCGQFMAITDKDGKITGIKRIDLGARERFAQARSLSSDQNPFLTSDQYQSSGQFSKDYISFLLSDPSLMRKYRALWVDLAQREQGDANIYNSSYKVIESQFAELSDDMKEQALNGFLEIVNKGVDESKQCTVPDGDIQSRITIFADKLAELDKNRIHHMRGLALEAAEKSISSLQNRIAKSYLKNDIAKLSQALLNKEPEGILTNLNSMMPAINKTLDFTQHNANFETVIEALTDFCEVSLLQLDRLQIKLLNETELDEDKLNAVNQEIERIESLFDMAQYWLTTKDENKKKAVLTIILKATQGKDAFVSFLEKNEHLYEDIALHSTYIGAMVKYFRGLAFGEESKAAGGTLMETLYNRFHIHQGKHNLNKFSKVYQESIKKKESDAHNYAELIKSCKLIDLHVMLQKHSNLTDQITLFMSLLASAIEADDNKVLEVLLSQNIIPQSTIIEIFQEQNTLGQNLLMECIVSGKPKCARLLLDKVDFHRSIQDKQGCTVLHLLAGHSHDDAFIQMMIKLLNKSTMTSDPCAIKNENGDTVLHHLILNNGLKMLNNIDKHCATSLYSGVYYHCKNALRASNNNHMTPIMIAAMNGNTQLIDFLAGKNMMALSQDAISAYKQIASMANLENDANKANAIQAILADYKKAHTSTSKGWGWGSSTTVSVESLPAFDEAYLDTILTKQRRVAP